MLDEQNKSKNTTLGILRERTILKIDDSYVVEENNRRELIKQIKEGKFKKP